MKYWFQMGVNVLWFIDTCMCVMPLSGRRGLFTVNRALFSTLCEHSAVLSHCAPAASYSALCADQWMALHEGSNRIAHLHFLRGVKAQGCWQAQIMGCVSSAKPFNLITIDSFYYSEAALAVIRAYYFYFKGSLFGYVHSPLILHNLTPLMFKVAWMAGDNTVGLSFC